MVTVNNREKLPWEESLTVRQLLDKMGYTYSLISVRVNDEYVPEEDYNSKLIPDQSNVTVFHLAHGG